jgi:hypothetical protein
MKLTLRHYIHSLIISVMAIVMTLVMPAMPVMAEETTAVDATNNSEQTAGSASSEVVQEPVVSVPEPTPPAAVDPPVETPVVEETIAPVVIDQTPTTESVVEPTTNSSAQQSENNSETPTTTQEFLAPVAPGADGVSSATVQNGLDSQAETGDATVHHNTTGGNATTGNADVIATILNILSSVTNWSGAPLNTFIQDIDGDVFGDITIDPRVMSNANYVAKKPADSLADSLDTDSRITNDINLSATTGNAGVHHNTTGGNATSGDANVLLNLINIINSWAAANQSFLGMININGSLNGDILLPQEFLQQLLASNSDSTTPTGNVSIDTDTTMGIQNNINLEAQSGEASVHHNGQAGSATTGDALTKMTILNLTNRQIIGSDAILVFVNVLGDWVGMIVNAPQGTTAAALGNASTNTGYGVQGDVELDIDTDAQIVNNINLSARSGDATVHHNSEAGDATSGDATTSLNLINIINSQLSFSDWFGILFINVFGNWNGSFGVDTAAGETVVTPEAPAPLVTFTPAVASKTIVKQANYSRTITVQTDDDNQNQAVMSVQIDNGNDAQAPAFTEINNLPIIMALGGLACFTVLGAAEKRNQKIRRYRLDSQIVWPTI